MPAAHPAAARRTTCRPLLSVGRAGKRAEADTVVVYVYSNTDPEYEGNLVYFLEKGVRANDGCDYIIVIQEVRAGWQQAGWGRGRVGGWMGGRLKSRPRCLFLLQAGCPVCCLQSASTICNYIQNCDLQGSDVEDTHNLPDTPSNVRFVRHANECYDWGTFGWVSTARGRGCRLRLRVYIAVGVAGGHLRSCRRDRRRNARRDS